MMLRILLAAFVVGTAGSGLYINRMCAKQEDFETSNQFITNAMEAGSIPTLYEADIDTLAKGLECREITSVHLAKVRQLHI